jgi:hypothetical protein
LPSTKIVQSSVDISEAARERDFCSCMEASNSDSLKDKFFSFKIKAVKSFGKPKVSYNSNAFAPETSDPFVFAITLSNNCNP